MRVVDVAELFGADYALHHRMFDYFPFDRHWNGYGNQLGAERAAALLAASDKEQASHGTAALPSTAADRQRP